MKYIIEIDNNNITSEYGLFLIYESLFDARILLKEEIRKLTPYTEPDTNEAYQRGVEDGAKSVENWNEQEKKLRMDEAYQKGLSDAWDAVRKIALDKEDGGLDTAAYCETFGYGKSFGAVLKTFTASEAIEKIRAYEQEQEEIKVGDEVLYEDEKGVVIVPEENGHYADAFTAGGMRICEPDYKLRKTGKHYPEIVKILQEMRKK